MTNFSTNHEETVQDHVTIEGLRNLYGSCFSCGVSWQQDHVSLDCRECGGYAMARPCPDCNGTCQSEWRRNLAASHSSQVATWEGSCSLTNSCSFVRSSSTSEFRSLESSQTQIKSLNKKSSTTQIVPPSVLKVS